MNTPLPIEHRPAEHRFVCQVDGLLSCAEYQLFPGRMVMTHTVVDPRLQGRGIAAALVAAALAHARAEGLKVVPRCSYVDAYMRRHPDTADLRA